MSPPTLKELSALHERLRVAQRELIYTAARASSGPSDSTVRKIAELESAILAVEHTMEDLKRTGGR
jgi:hypothetical protein